MHLVHHRGGCAGGAVPSALIVTRNYIGQPAGASVQFARCSGPRHSGHMYISVDSSVTRIDRDSFKLDAGPTEVNNFLAVCLASRKAAEMHVVSVQGCVLWQSTQASSTGLLKLQDLQLVLVQKRH